MRFIHLSLITIAALVCLSFGEVRAADTSSYRLAYISYDDGQLWTIKPDGTDAQQITPDSADKRGLMASPDGKYLAYYVMYKFQSFLFYYTFGILDLLTEKQQLITGEEAITDLSWSPDSQHLLFTIHTLDDNLMKSAIYRVNRDGSERTKIIEVGGRSAGVSWSPDSQHILFTEQQADGAYDISVMDAEGRNSHVVAHFDSCFICLPPQWTPNGQAIVFYKHPDLFIVDADGQNLRQVTDFAQVYNITDVSYARYDALTYSIRSDGQVLYYTMGYPMQIVKLNLGADSWRKRTILYDDQTHIITGNLLSPDDKLLFFNADSPQGSLLSSLDLDTRKVMVLATNASEAVIIAGA